MSETGFSPEVVDQSKSAESVPENEVVDPIAQSEKDAEEYRWQSIKEGLAESINKLGTSDAQGNELRIIAGQVQRYNIQEENPQFMAEIRAQVEPKIDVWFQADMNKIKATLDEKPHSTAEMIGFLLVDLQYLKDIGVPVATRAAEVRGLLDDPTHTESAERARRWAGDIDSKLARLAQ